MQFEVLLESTGHPGRDAPSEDLLEKLAIRAGEFGHRRVSSSGEFLIRVGQEPETFLLADEFRVIVEQQGNCDVLTTIGGQLASELRAIPWEQVPQEFERFLSWVSHPSGLPLRPTPSHEVASALLAEHLGALLLDNLDELRARMEQVTGDLISAQERIAALERELDNLRAANRERSGPAKAALIAGVATVVAALIGGAAVLGSSLVSAQASARPTSQVSADEVHALAVEVAELCQSASVVQP